MWRAVLFVMLARAVGHADSAMVTVTLTPQGQDLAQGLGDSPQMLIDKVKGKIDDYYQLARVGTVLREFVDATSFVNRDLGVDYAARGDEITFGVVGDGVLASDAQLSSTGHVTAGTAVNFAIIGGVKRGRWSGYGNVFYESGELHQLTGHLTSAAAHVQYRLVERPWWWVDATSGLELTRWTLGAAQPIETTVTVQGTAEGSSRNLRLVSIGTLSLVANTLTIPVEVSAGARLGPVSVYAGGGLDLSLGKSTLASELDGEMTITADGTDVGHVTITASGDGSPTTLVPRALAGLQIQVPYFALFVQGNAASTAVSLSVGVRGVL